MAVMMPCLSKKRYCDSFFLAHKHPNTHHHISLLHQSLLTQVGGLHIVAVGSVLVFCWDLLKEGK